MWLSAGRASGPVHLRAARVLTESWYTVREYDLDVGRRDGTQQHLRREDCRRGDRIGVLAHGREPDRVILTRQFRLPPWVAGHPTGMLIEVAGGLVGSRPVLDAVRTEVAEETGYRVVRADHVHTVYIHPQMTSERTYLFTAEVAATKISAGGGIMAEGEDIEVLELPLTTALDLIEQGEIVDGKTILLLYHALLRSSFND